MKTTVSIPDDLFIEADRLAERIGATRSAFYARALRDHINRREDEEITKAINAALEDIDQSDNADFVAEAARQTARRLDW